MQRGFRRARRTVCSRGSSKRAGSLDETRNARAGTQTRIIGRWTSTAGPAADDDVGGDSKTAAPEREWG